KEKKKETIDFETKHWPIADEFKKYVDEIKYEYKANPLCVYGKNGFIEPAKVEEQLKGALIELRFRLHHYFIEKDHFHSFNAGIEQIIILQPGEASVPSDYKRKNVRDGPIPIDGCNMDDTHIDDTPVRKERRLSLTVDSDPFQGESILQRQENKKQTIRRRSADGPARGTEGVRKNGSPEEPEETETRGLSKSAAKRRRQIPNRTGERPIRDTRENRGRRNSTITSQSARTASEIAAASTSHQADEPGESRVIGAQKGTAAPWLGAHGHVPERKRQHDGKARVVGCRRHPRIKRPVIKKNHERDKAQRHPVEGGGQNGKRKADHARTELRDQAARRESGWKATVFKRPG
ncbi:hypothetical protein EDB84DRAFT_1447291, partial [Lactarius hengduanensis]